MKSYLPFIMDMKLFRKIDEFLRERAKRHGYTCDACGREVFLYPKERVCENCYQEFYGEETPICEKCGRETYTKGVCLTCKSILPNFTKGFSPFTYTGRVASLINRLKTGEKRMAFFLGEEMAKHFIEKTNDRLFQGEKYLLVPVPLTDKRRKERGYNQAEELALSIAEVLEKEGYEVELAFDVLQKTRDGEMQKHLTAVSRAENVSGAYHVHRRALCKDRTILLIDDVLTTGATGSECAKLLFGAGAKKIYFLTASAVPEQKS